MYLHAGVKIRGTITINGIQYPLNWWDAHSSLENSVLGVTKVADPVTPDPMYYTWTENPDGSLTIVARDPALIAADQAAIAAATQDNTDLQVLKQNSQLKTFVNMTPAQVNSYIDTNVTSLATAIPVLKLLSQAVLVLSRQQLR